MVKNPPANARDMKDAGSILGYGRTPAGEHGNPLQYSCLENPMDREEPDRLQSIVSHGVGQDWSNLAHTYMHVNVLPLSPQPMAPHCSTLAWKIPWVEEPGRLQSMGSLRVGHDWATWLSFSLSCIGEGNGNPLQCFCLKNPRDGGAWWAAVCGVAQSQTRLKWLSSSSSSSSLNP